MMLETEKGRNSAQQVKLSQADGLNSASDKQKQLTEFKVP
jgi:hypothetical protein